MLELSGKKIKIAITTMLNEVKENMLLTDVVKNPQRKRKYKKRTKWKF